MPSFIHKWQCISAKRRRAAARR